MSFATDSDMDQPIERYLNDHHAGASGALHLIRQLAERQEIESERLFFQNLQKMVEKDQTLLKDLLEKANMEKSLTLQIAGTLTEGAGRLKLLWEGLKPGELGMFEALEVLALGIQGKRLLWAMLGELSPYFPEWDSYDFAELELQAIKQRDQVEERRIETGRESLLDGQRYSQWAAKISGT